MESWAKRIAQLLAEQKHLGKSEAGIARACGIANNSVSQWFGRVKDKPATGSLKAETAIHTAKYLGTTVEWMMLGRGNKEASQDLDFDPEILGQAFVATEKAARSIGVEYDAAQVPELLIYAYKMRPALKLGRDRKTLDDFDSMVRKHLELEMGRDHRTTERNAVQSGIKDAQTAANRKKAGGSRK